MTFDTDDSFAQLVSDSSRTAVFGDPTTPATVPAPYDRTPIVHSSFRRVLESMARLHSRHRHTGVGGGMLVTGQSGSGKSLVRKCYAKHFPPIRTAERDLMPVLQAVTPSKPTVKNLVIELLRQIGDPVYANSGPESAKTTRLLQFLRDHRTEIILIDEFNHFPDHANRAALEVTDWLKNLHDACGLPIVLFGLPRSAVIVRQNNQMRRRFARTVSTTPFSADTKPDWLEFLSVLSTLHDRSPVGTVAFHEPDMATRFFFASAGLMDFLVRIVSGAIEKSRASGASITQETLAQAFRDEVWSAAPDDLNPFIAPVNDLRPLTASGEPFEQWDTTTI
jgi:type II secretory pathway predicted ATPase ExeA